jgi:type IV pilus assembly protein PilV
MPRVFPSSNPTLQQGVVLLESLIAILIFSIGILGVVGMQAVMIKNSNDSKYRAIASFVAQQKIGLIWADPDPSRPGYTSPVESETDISNLLPAGTRTVTTPAVGQFIITITWQLPGSTEEHNFTTTARITGG